MATAEQCSSSTLHEQPGRLLTAREASELTGLSEHTLANMRCSGRSIPYFKVGRYVRYDEHEVRSWMRSRRYTSTSQEVAA